MFTPRTKVCLFSNSLQSFPFAVVYDETIVSTGAREFVEMSGKVVDCLENNVFNSRLKWILVRIVYQQWQSRECWCSILDI